MTFLLFINLLSDYKCLKISLFSHYLTDIIKKYNSIIIQGGVKYEKSILS